MFLGSSRVKGNLMLKNTELSKGHLWLDCCSKNICLNIRTIRSGCKTTSAINRSDYTKTAFLKCFISLKVCITNIQGKIDMKFQQTICAQCKDLLRSRGISQDRSGIQNLGNGTVCRNIGWSGSQALCVTHKSRCEDCRPVMWLALIRLLIAPRSALTIVALASSKYDSQVLGDC